MKYLKKFNESKGAIDKESIDSICKKYGIENYRINEDGSIDVDGNVYIADEKLTSLPLTFRNVDGDFSCSYNNLTNLIGAPQKAASFYCNNNKLTSLEGAPISVGGGFYCSNNQLTSLEYAPQTVSGYFSCGDNELITLKGAPKSVGGSFNCNNNQLITLEGIPESIKELFCDNNLIHKWWNKVDDVSKLEIFLYMGIYADDPDEINEDKIKEIIG